MASPRRVFAIMLLATSALGLYKPPLYFQRRASPCCASMSSTKQRRVSVRMKRMGGVVVPTKWSSRDFRLSRELQQETPFVPSAPPLFDPATIGLLGGLSAVVLLLNAPMHLEMLVQLGASMLDALSGAGAACAPRTRATRAPPAR